MSKQRVATWQPALWAVPISLFILGLYYYWFGIADRYVVFLYYHDMGPVVPDTTPFSVVTSSRYWMAGLVATGAVMVLYTFVLWLLGRVVAGYKAPAWWRVWGWCVPLLLAGIPAITMTVNRPVLPLPDAAETTLAALVGLALALLPGRWAVERPAALALLAVDGVGLMLLLVSMPGVENIGRWLASGAILYVYMLVAIITAGLGLLLFMSGLRAWLRIAPADWKELFLAGVCVAYLFLPLLHHVGFTDGYYYITNHDNFFPRNVLLRVAAWLLGATVAWGITRLRVRLAARREPSTGVAQSIQGTL